MRQNPRRHLLPPWASFRSGARFKLRLVDAAWLRRLELGAVPLHGMHNDRRS